MNSSAPESLNATDWEAFIGAEVDRTRNAYLSQPSFLTGHFRGERQIADDYAGRELLELVQNAADAATEVGGEGRVRIDIWPEGLTVANTGAPFRPGGVQSLMSVHASDKPGRNADLIGTRGLGFRALLNWSLEPVISSGALEVGFSSAHAHRVIDELAALQPAIAALCNVEEEADKPAPILAFPAIGEAIVASGAGLAADLLARARALRSDGFDTVVAAAFEREDSFEQASRQASEFKPNFLLFVPSLVEIEIRVEGRTPTKWTRTVTGADTVSLQIEGLGGEELQSWILRRRAGAVPVKSRKKPARYALAFALRTDKPNGTGALHAFFPTSVPLPFPGLFHATLELDSNRKLFKANSLVNDGVLKALAVFFADTLADLSRARRIDNALDFLHRSNVFPESLKAFEAATYAAAADRPLIPTMKGRRVRAAATRLGPPGYDQYLPRRVFGDLARCRDTSDRQTLERLGVAVLQPAETIDLLRKGDLTLDERASAILGVARNLPAQHHHPGLLLDQNERILKSSNTAFPPPASDEKLPRLPDWAKARFVLPQLWRLILRKAPGQPPREIIRLLSAFGVSEYSNESIIASLRSQAAKALGGRRDADQVQRELLAALYGLYSPLFRAPPGIFRVRCQDGVWRDSRETHLAAHYGLAGRVTGALYSSMPAELVADPDVLGLPGDDGDAVGAFLVWLGVNAWPRLLAASAIPLTCRPVVKEALPATVLFRDGASQQQVDRKDLTWGYNLQAQSRMIAGLDRILRDAPSDAILAWLSFDPRFEPNAPGFPTSVTGRKDGKASFRNYFGAVPDLVHHLIVSTPWLRARTGEAGAPVDMMIDPGRLKVLFERPAPALEGSEVEFGLNEAQWRRGLDRSHVPYGLADLPIDRLIKLLKSLPDRNVTADVVKRLYLQVLELDRFETSRAPLVFRDFLETGKVQVMQGKYRGWVRPQEALYADRDGFPAAAREHLALIDLPPRRNGGHVAERFGVAPLSQQSFGLTVTSYDPEESFLAATLRSALESARPYIGAFRQAMSNETAHQRRFDRLKLIVARAARIKVEIGQRHINGDLETWTHVLQGDELIIVIEPHRSPDEVIALAIEAIADGLAELFAVQSGAEFGRLLAASSDGLRRRLVMRMLPNQTDAEIDALLGRPDAEEIYEPVMVDAATLALGPAPALPSSSLTASPVPTPGSNDGARAAVTSGPVAGAPAERPATPTSVTSSVLTPTTSITPAPTLVGRPQFRIAKITGAIGSSAVHDPYRAADAELWSELFEESEGRFPLSVAHLQGPDAYGCDCLSFASAEDREAFKADPKQTALVARFIETKSGAVRLTNSQVRAAELRGNRYFIYKVEFYSGSRSYAELTIVADPLKEAGALVTECELVIDKVVGRTCHRLVPESAH